MRFALGATPLVYQGSTLQRSVDTIAERSKPRNMQSTVDAVGMGQCKLVGTSGARPG